MSRISNIIIILWKDLRDLFCSLSGNEIKLGDNLIINTFGVSKGFVTINVVFGIDVMLSHRVDVKIGERIFFSLVSSKTSVPFVLYDNGICLVFIRIGDTVFVRINSHNNTMNMNVPMSDVTRAVLDFQAANDKI